MKPQEGVTKSAFKVTFGSIFGLVLGFGAQVLIASIFGAGAEMDAYLTALVVPLYIQSILLSGLSFVFIPAFIQDSMDGRKEKAWSLAGTFFWLTAGILTFLALIGVLSASSIISITAPGLSHAKAAIAQQLLGILLLSVPLIGLASLCEGIQNARGQFLVPALGPAAGSIVNIIILVLLYQRIGTLALAWGFVLSAAVRASISVVPVLRHGWKGLLSLRDSKVREMGRLILPFIVFGLITRSTPVFERYFASSLPDGDLSYLGYASRIGRWAMALLGHGLSVAIFPAMSRAFARDGDRGLVEKSEFGLRMTLATALPAIAIISALSIPLVAIFFERGAFRDLATISVSRIVPLAIISEVFLRMSGNVIGRTYYVKKDTVTGPLIFVVTFVLYFLLARALVGALGYVGLALAQPLHSGLVILVLLLLIMRRLPYFHWANLIRDGVFLGAASLVAYVIAKALSDLLITSPLLVQFALPALAAVSAYLLIVSLINHKIAQSILEMSGLQQVFSQARLGVRQVMRMSRG